VFFAAYLNRVGRNAKFELAGDRLGAILGVVVRDDVAKLTAGSIYRPSERWPGIWVERGGGRKVPYPGFYLQNAITIQLV
jgi:hypothetical protein